MKDIWSQRGSREERTILEVDRPKSTLRTEISDQENSDESGHVDDSDVDERTIEDNIEIILDTVEEEEGKDGDR